MCDESKILTDANNITEKEPAKQVSNNTKPWDEARVVVFLIGFCLLIEGLLIYFQAGISQVLVAGVTGLGGLAMVLMAWLLPFDISDEDVELDQETAETIEDNHKQSEIAAKAAEEEKKAAAQTSETIESSSAEPQKSVEKVVETEAKSETKLEETPKSWFERLSLGLSKTRTGFISKVKTLILGKTKIDEDLMDELEETLFEADIGVKTTEELLENLKKKVAEEDIKDPQVIYASLRDQLRSKLSKYTEKPRFNENGLTLFLVIGVNGVGKTTTIAKLANKFKNDGKKVMLAAGDTFRAAAIDQLRIWGERAGVEVISGQEGGDPGALVFDAVHAAKKRGADLLIVDTAGRMHVKANLMAELNKILKIAQKESDGGPQEILLVFDATTGQNAVQQAKQFREILPITGLVVTKLDGTAKGGVLFAVEEEVSVPVKFIGVGEKMEDLMTFEPEQFLDALFADDSDKKKESDYKVVK